MMIMVMMVVMVSHLIVAIVSMIEYSDGMIFDITKRMLNIFAQITFLWQWGSSRQAGGWWQCLLSDQLQMFIITPILSSVQCLLPTANVYVNYKENGLEINISIWRGTYCYKVWSNPERDMLENPVPKRLKCK